MNGKTIVISRSYERVDQFRAAKKETGQRIRNILSCDIEGFSLHNNEYPQAIIKYTAITRPGEDGIETRTKYLKCKSIEFNMEFEEITQDQYESRYK